MILYIVFCTISNYDNKEEHGAVLYNICVLKLSLGAVQISRDHILAFARPPSPQMITLLSNCDHIWALAGPPLPPLSDHEIFEQPLEVFPI